ncbi:unnamed protein product [Danaus chrysippus]|uniref:(African queen) hypothetical protein n=1 Tax=Danaus chrysippus TaxID=151541 RepID=A0A8J2QCH7_9NEOP|nr:unnamed protein product [Danaus chrysippus]
MEESVALDTSKQKQFVKSVRGIKKLLKKKGKVSKPPVVKEAEPEVVESNKSDKIKGGKIIKRRRRGLVYLAHIPHGFYEHEMTEYFKQFGVVTNARVIRSKRTGSSKGYAFVEFKEPTVAQIVAETMNNYLMGKRLIKAVYIPPSKQKRRALRKKWNSQNNPTARLRMRLKRRHNAKKSEEDELKYAQRMLANLNNTKKKLSEIEINYDFFKPVDVPAELIDKIQNESVIDVKPKEEIKEEPEVKPKKTKKELKSDNKLKVTQEIPKQNIKAKPEGKPSVKKSKRVNIEEANQQKDKQAKLDKAGVKALEDFIQIKDSDGDSDSSIDFDSDEYEKMIENDDDSLFDDDSDVEENEKPQNDKKKINKTKKAVVPKQVNVVQNQRTKVNNKNVNNKKIKQPQKRKAATVSESAVKVKNAKFEKQNKNKSLNKVMKKKK